MKTMIKNVTMLLAFIMVAFNVNAQTLNNFATKDGVTYILGMDNGITSGNAADLHRYVLGGSAEANIPVADNTAFTASVGYLNFFHKDNIYGTGRRSKDAHQLPVKAGIKYFPVSSLFLQAEAGGGFALNKSDLNYDKAVAFIYSPQIGYQLALNEKSVLIASIR